MAKGDTTVERTAGAATPRSAGRTLGLLLAWSAEEPGRTGEVLLVRRRDGEVVLGRDERCALVRQRPGRSDPTGPLDDRTVSRRQLSLAAEGEGALHVRNEGRGELSVDGRPADEATIRPGSVLQVDDRLVLLCVRRPAVLPDAPSFPVSEHPRFGRPDRYGLVGESPLAWALRDQAAMVGRLPHHVLVLGESGAGKELMANAVHGLSPRRDRKLLARNAATIPPGLAAAELFGTVRNYPQGGMASRPGLVGEAHGGTLFLDEVGELPEEMQAQLLRVLDAHGEYQRLGEVKVRRSDLRVVAATNRRIEELRHDLAPRFKLRVFVPGLNERRDDVPLLVRHLLAFALKSDEDLGRRFAGAGGAPRIDPALVAALCRHDYTHHVRELDGFLWRALTESRGDTIELGRDLRRELGVDLPAEPVAPEDVTADMIRESLARCDGVLDHAWRDLGLSSRFQLGRLMKRLGVEREAGGAG